MDEPHAWRYLAKCQDEDTNLFYPPRNKALYKPIADKAKGICFGRDGRPECKVRRACLWNAIETDEPHGIWGGMSHRERNALVRKWRAKYAHQISLEDFVKKGPPV